MGIEALLENCEITFGLLDGWRTQEDRKIRKTQKIRQDMDDDALELCKCLSNFF
jgi:hypothetical protein